MLTYSKTRSTLLIIRIALSLLLCAFALFSTADLLPLPEFITQLGLGLLFSAFLLLLMTSLVVIGKQILLAITAYCSSIERGQRRLLFIQAKHAQLRQYFYCRALRLSYDHEQQRQHLLQRDNRKHLAALSKAIDQELKAVKATLPKSKFKQLQQENRRYRQQQNSEALLQLQQKITTLRYDC